MSRLLHHIFPFVLVGFLALLSACRNEYDYPVEPTLKYKDFVWVKTEEGEITKGILVLEFTDGDGDIGLGQGDTLPPFHLGGDHYYNFYIRLFTKNSGQYNPIIFPDTNFTFNSRIPRIEFNGNSKAIKGVLEYTFDMVIMYPFLSSDTIMIETYIKDRGMHLSNTVQTPDIVFPW